MEYPGEFLLVLELSIHFYTHKKYDMVVLISALVLGLGLYQRSHFRLGLIQATRAETRADIKTRNFIFYMPHTNTSGWILFLTHFCTFQGFLPKIPTVARKGRILSVGLIINEFFKHINGCKRIVLKMTGK